MGGGRGLELMGGVSFLSKGGSPLWAALFLYTG